MTPTYARMLPDGFDPDHHKPVPLPHVAPDRRNPYSNNTSGYRGLSHTHLSGYDYWQCNIIDVNIRQYKTFPFTDTGKMCAIMWLKNKREELGIPGGFDI